MASLKNIKEKIGSINKTIKVTKAMESISAIKMRKTQEKVLNSRIHFLNAFGVLKRLSVNIQNDLNKYFQKNKKKPGSKCYLLISSNKGLTGSFNLLLNKKVASLIKEEKDAVFCCIGEKGYKFIKKNKLNLLEYFEGIEDEIREEDIKKISIFLTEKFNSEKIKSVEVIYTEFINTSEQHPVNLQIFPITYENLKIFIKESIPTKGKYADTEKTEIEDYVGPYIFEPDINEFIRNMFPKFIEFGIYYTFLESKASEHSARMIFMKNAVDKSKDILVDLKSKFNKERQAAITKEISEISSGAESLSD